MSGINCPYCTQNVQLHPSSVVPEHYIKHNDPGPEKCPMSWHTLYNSTQTQFCADCGQLVKMFENANGDLIPEGHTFSWASGPNGERIKIPSAPDASFYSKVWCNSQSRVFFPIEQRGYPYPLAPNLSEPSILVGRR